MGVHRRSRAPDPVRRASPARAIRGGARQGALRRAARLRHPCQYLLASLDKLGNDHWPGARCGHDPALSELWRVFPAHTDGQYGLGDQRQHATS